MSCSIELYVGNSSVVELQALTNSVTGALETAATVTCTIKDSAGVDVAGMTFPISMPHTSVDGTYRATLQDGIAIIAGRRYTAVVDAVGSAGEVGHWEAPVTADTRECM